MDLYSNMSAQDANKLTRFLRSPIKKAHLQQHTIQDGFKADRIERDYQRGLYNPHYETLLNRSAP
jgi:hypothetical protein